MAKTALLVMVYLHQSLGIRYVAKNEHWFKRL